MKKANSNNYNGKTLLFSFFLLLHFKHIQRVLFFIKTIYYYEKKLKSASTYSSSASINTIIFIFILIRHKCIRIHCYYIMSSKKKGVPLYHHPRQHSSSVITICSTQHNFTKRMGMKSRFCNKGSDILDRNTGFRRDIMFFFSISSDFLFWIICFSAFRASPWVTAGGIFTHSGFRKL